MITLFGTGPMFGLPHASPFAIKTEMLLKLSRLPYKLARADIRKAPRGKIPWIKDGEAIITDSRMIRHHLETRHGVDFSGGYDAKSQAVGLAVERLLEDHLYFFNVDNRWLVPDNFAKGPKHFFNAVPAPLRPFIRWMVLRRVRAQSMAQGTGRLEGPEKIYLVERAIDALSDILGESSYMLGPRVSGADATAFAFLASVESPFFTSPYGDYLRSKPEISAYLSRMRAEFYPDFQG